MIKYICNSATNIAFYLKRNHLKELSLKSETRQKCPLAPLLFIIELKVSANVIREGKRITGK